MGNYFKYNEIGNILNILRTKFNLFQRTHTMAERRPLYKKISRIDEIDYEFHNVGEEKNNLL